MEYAIGVALALAVVPCRFQNRSGFVAVDQLRTVDSERLVKRLGELSASATTAVLDTLQEMFEE